MPRSRPSAHYPLPCSSFQSSTRWRRQRRRGATAALFSVPTSCGSASSKARVATTGNDGGRETPADMMTATRPATDTRQAHPKAGEAAEWAAAAPPVPHCEMRRAESALCRPPRPPRCPRGWNPAAAPRSGCASHPSQRPQEPPATARLVPGAPQRRSHALQRWSQGAPSAGEPRRRRCWRPARGHIERSAPCHEAARLSGAVPADSAATSAAASRAAHAAAAVATSG